jgi:hypothetical protein
MPQELENALNALIGAPKLEKRGRREAKEGWQ